jgi:hypothetical protein
MYVLVKSLILTQLFPNITILSSPIRNPAISFQWTGIFFNSRGNCIYKHNDEFDISLTVHRSVDLFQLPTSCTIYLFYNNTYYIIILDVFRAIPCSSSGGQIVLLQHLVSSLYSVHRLRADSEESALNRCTEYLLTESADTICCNNTIWPPEDEHCIARNMSRIIM